jgi:hypothetical protein
MRWAHILAGLIGIASGAVALAALKGARLHRRGLAMFFATGAFFLGQPQVFAGGPLAPPALRGAPVVAVIIVTLYWLARLSLPGTRPSMRIGMSRRAE